MIKIYDKNKFKNTRRKDIIRLCSIHNKSLSSIIRNTMMNRIEDEFDIKTFSEYEVAKEKGNLKTRPIEELWEKIDL